MHFIEEIQDQLKSAFGNRPDEEEDIEETKEYASDAHSNHVDEAHGEVAKHKEKHGHITHEIAAGSAAVFLLHKANQKREKEGKKPIGKVKEFLAFAVAMQAEKYGERAFDQHKARKQAHEIVNNHGAEIGEADRDDIKL